MERHQSNLRGKIALITGANQGIGLAIARALAFEGCDLVITGRNQSRLNHAAKVLHSEVRLLARTQQKHLPKRSLDEAPPRKVLPVICDVRDPLAVRDLFAKIKKQFRRVDILINNAGTAHSSMPIATLPYESWLEVVDTNLNGMFLVTQAALPLMKRGCAIVNNLSIAAKRVFPGSASYSASKHGALGFTNTLREELRPRGIRVIALLPGATDTAIWNKLWPEAPRKKMMSPETVAAAVVNALLTSEDSTVEELTILPAAGSL